jgi:hypothetical protein
LGLASTPDPLHLGLDFELGIKSGIYAGPIYLKNKLKKNKSDLSLKNHLKLQNKLKSSLKI